MTRAYLSLVLRKTVNYYLVINSSLNPHWKAAVLVIHFRIILPNFEDKFKELKVQNQERTGRGNLEPS